MDTNRDPIAFANVYIDQSSIGATTDLDGNYILKYVPLGQKRLIITQVNYEKAIIVLNLKSPVDIKRNIFLKEEITVSDQIVVEAEYDDAFVKLYNRFKPDLLGYSDFAKECEVLNREFLELNERIGGAYAGKTAQPLHIINHALGYELFYDIDSVENMDKMFTIRGDVIFKQMVPENEDQEKKWLRNRKTAFKYSLRYFLKALYHKKTKSRNLYYGKLNNFPSNDSYSSTNIRYESFIKPHLNNFKRLNLNDNVLEIIQLRNVPLDYRRHFRKTIVFDENKLISFLKVNGTLDFNEDGYFISAGGFKAYEIEGYLTFYRVAGLLPDDYDPDSNSINKSD